MATRSWKVRSFLMAATLLVALFAGLTAMKTASAVNPTTMSFQGKVVNANGTNVTDGTYSFVFRLYTLSSGGSSLWTETQSSVTVTAGVFQVNLGSSCPFFVANACNSSTPIDFNANPNLYLGITFNSDPAGEMSPRVQLQSVPFAYNADKVGGLTVSQLVQLSPGSQQSGFINVSGASTIGGGLTVTTGGATVGGTLSVTSSSAAANAGLFTGAANATAPVVILRDGATPQAGGDLLQWQNSSSVMLGAIQSDGVINMAGVAGSVQYQNAVTSLGDKLGLYASTTFGRYGLGIQANTLVAHIGATSAAFAVRVDPGSGQASSGTNVFAVTGLGNVAAAGTITGTTLNGTTGINTGATGGTQRIDNTGNLLNIANLTMTGNFDQSASTGTFQTGSGAISLNGNTSVTGTKTLTVGTGLTTLGGGLNVTGNINTTNGNILIQQTAAGASAIFDNLAGKIGSIKAGSAKLAFLFDNTGNFSIGSETRVNIAASNTAGTDILTILGANGNVGIGDSTPAATFTVGNGDLFQITGATGTVNNAGGYIQSGVVANILSGATSFTASGTALTVTNTASVGTLVVTTAGASVTGGINNNSGGITNAGVISGVTSITGTGALAVAAGGTAQNLTLNASTTGQVQIGGTSTGDILFGGGSGSTGCTVTNASGNFACTATITAATFNATTSYQANGIAGISLAACAAAQYIGNGVKVDDGLITAGTCRNDAAGISDIRLKQNVTSINPASALSALNQLRPVSYEFNELYHEVTGDPLEYGLQYGFIAQEVQQVMPGLVNTDINGQDGFYGIDYHAFYGLLTAAVQELSVKVENVVADDKTFNDGIISSSLVASGALVINSGLSGDVTIDSGGISAAVNIGTEKAAAVNIASAGAATNIHGALVTEGSAEFRGNVTMSFSSPSASFKINNSSNAQAVDTAIEIIDSSGAGFSKLIDTSNFKVAGSGDVVTRGSLTSKGGTFQLLDAYDNQLISFDQDGSANFKGNLNLASASLTGGLTVGGDVNVAGLSTFQKMATFLAKTVFRQDVEFEGHITVAKDSAGYAMFRAGESQVHVSFIVPYLTEPVVTANLTDGQFGMTSIDNVTTQGFDIHLREPATTDTKLSWTALGVQEPQTASNPLTLSP